MKIINQVPMRFWYFLIIAPILAKIIEWIYQLVAIDNFDFIKSVWVGQLGFIVLLSFIVFIFYGGFRKALTISKLSSIVGLAYFLKEFYNFVFVSQAFNQSTLIALTLEPIFMWVLLGLWLPKLLGIKK